MRRISSLSLASVVAFAVPLIVVAINSISTGFSVSASSVTINAHDVCRTARSTDGNRYFVPTKTSAEWASVRSHTPAGLTLDGCGGTINVNQWLATHGFPGGGPEGAGCNITATPHFAYANYLCRSEGYGDAVSYTGGAKWTSRMCKMQSSLSQPVVWGDPSCSGCSAPMIYAITCGAP